MIGVSGLTGCINLRTGTFALYTSNCSVVILNALASVGTITSTTVSPLSSCHTLAGSFVAGNIGVLVLTSPTVA